MTPRFAALSTAEKALLSDSRFNKALKLSMAVLALVLVALLYPLFFLSDLSFLIADLVIGICDSYFTTTERKQAMVNQSLLN